MLFTFETVAEIDRLGGSSAWKLNRDRAGRCRHAVLVRNDRYEENGIEHGTALRLYLLRLEVTTLWQPEEIACGEPTG